MDEFVKYAINTAIRSTIADRTIQITLTIIFAQMMELSFTGRVIVRYPSSPKRFRLKRDTITTMHTTKTATRAVAKRPIKSMSSS